MNTYEILDLQLFAGEMNVNTTLSPGLSVENKTFYDKSLIEEAKPNLVHDQFAQKRDIPKNSGKTIEFRKYASLPKITQPLEEGVTPDGQSLEVTSIEATVEQYGGYITYSDVMDLTMIDNNVLEAVKLIGGQAGSSLDTITRNVLQSGTNVFYAPKGDGTEVTSREALDGTCRLTGKLVRRVAAFLKKVNAPKINGSYVAIIHPYVAFDLQNDPEWQEAHKYSDATALFEGELGKLGGVRFVESSEAKVYENGIFGCLFLGANAYGTTKVDGGGLKTIIKQVGSSGVADALDQRGSVGWKAMKTAEILIQAYIVRVEVMSELSGEIEAN